MNEEKCSPRRLNRMLKLFNLSGFKNYFLQLPLLVLIPLSTSFIKIIFVHEWVTRAEVLFTVYL